MKRFFPPSTTPGSAAAIEPRWAVVAAAVVMLIALAGCSEGMSAGGSGESASPRPAEGDTAGDENKQTQTVTLGGRRFVLELALTPEERFQGLSDRPVIEPDGGMLFVFPRAGRMEFVMRRCLVPIDIAFIDPSGRITAMHEMRVEPYDTPEARLRRYPSRYPAQYVIEVAGGTLRELDLSIGDRVDLPYERLKSRAR